MNRMTSSENITGPSASAIPGSRCRHYSRGVNAGARTLRRFPLSRRLRRDVTSRRARGRLAEHPAAELFSGN
jgi:hypothetical protein